ncbi:39S ribosomal protein L41, mitochondrial [Tetranychus urticae]|uniref:39S ribosomal protein L41, mitochondrial n=1 Tax=Tetranychus urticae TaxID=32264 RepID=T1K5X8_TETUR|nr:39S ribosomal protein L41, mitochondrial [Tetranychus urticae]
MLIIPKRGFHLSTVNCKSLKNFSKFPIPNVRNAYEPKRIPKRLFEDFYNYPISRDPLGIRWPGYWFKRKFVYVKEMEPELVVPDLNGFNLKPYVSYRVPKIENNKLTAEELFKLTYGNKIIEASMNGEKVEVSFKPEDSEAAKLKHLQTGADMFCSRIADMEEEDEEEDEK